MRIEECWSRKKIQSIKINGDFLLISLILLSFLILFFLLRKIRKLVRFLYFFTTLPNSQGFYVCLSFIHIFLFVSKLKTSGYRHDTFKLNEQKILVPDVPQNCIITRCALWHDDDSKQKQLKKNVKSEATENCKFSQQ